MSKNNKQPGFYDRSGTKDNTKEVHGGRNCCDKCENGKGNCTCNCSAHSPTERKNELRKTNNKA